jgi:hypothetical protein
MSNSRLSLISKTGALEFTVRDSNLATVAKGFGRL